MKIIFLSLLAVALLLVSPLTFKTLGPGHFSYPQEDVERDIADIHFSSFFQLFHSIYGKNAGVFADEAIIGGIQQINYRVKILFENYPVGLEGQRITIIQLSNIKFGIDGDKKYFDFIAAPWNRTVVDAAKYQIPIRMVVESMNNNRLIIGPVRFFNVEGADDFARQIVVNFNKDVEGNNYSAFYDLLLRSRADSPTWGRAAKASLSTVVPFYRYEFKPISDLARFLQAVQTISFLFILFMILKPLGHLGYKHLLRMRASVLEKTPLREIDKDASQ